MPRVKFQLHNYSFKRGEKMGGSICLLHLNHFCKQHEIDIPDMNVHYTRARGRSRS
jgi:hypothetical protein